MTDLQGGPAFDAVRREYYPMEGMATDLDPLMDMIGDARFVLIGEATHGTHEFYQTRAELTKRLIQEKGFNAVAAEADWPDALRVNRFVRGESDDKTPEEALSGFERFPQWMWANTVVRDFAAWLRSHNQQAHGHGRGFFGLDLYSLYSSMNAVISYLETVDPEAAKRARARYSCFEMFHQDTQTYGYAAAFGAAEPCEDEVVAQLVELRTRAAEYAHRDGQLVADEYFYAEQNARVAKDAEEYYRSMFRGRVSSWNLRDTHMADTLDALARHLEQRDGHARIAVWEHNSHLGDARATEMGDAGEVNVGQLTRTRHPGETILIGFTTHTGTVTAANDWDEPADRKRVRPSIEGSYERFFHNINTPSFILPLRERPEVSARLREPRLERAIGVVYRPETERLSHYFYAQLPAQFDAIIHLDETHALEPLERTPRWGSGEAPETYPTAI